MTASTVQRRIRTGTRQNEPSWGALFVVLAGIFVVTLDFFIVNVAIPSVQGDLHASTASIQFVVAGYGLALAAGLVTGGRLGDLYGRRRMYATGMALFAVASAACGIAPSTGTLVGARVVQGLAAAMLMPQLLAILSTVYTGHRRAVAFNAYGIAIGVAAVFGQLLGGALIRADVAGLGWRTIFLINVPVGIGTLAVLRRLVPESSVENGARVDARGTALISAGLVAVVLPLVAGRAQGWPAWTWLCLAAAAPLLAALALSQRALARRGGAPLVEPALFGERAFSVGLAAVLAYFCAMASFFLLLALFLQQGRGLSALGSGGVFSVVGAGFFVSSALAPRLKPRLGRQLLALGGLTVAAGYLLLAGTVADVGTTGGIGWLVPALFVAGFGMGLAMVEVSAAVIEGVRPEHAAAASGVLSTAQQVGGALGVALVGIVFYDALGTDPTPTSFGHAFTVSLLLLAGFATVVAALVQWMPHRP